MSWAAPQNPQRYLPKSPRPLQLAPGRKPRELAILAISDIRSQPLDDLVGHLCRLQNRPDLIIYAGDDVARFQQPTGNYFQELASFARFGLVSVIGNDDGPDARNLITGRGVYEVHGHPVRVGDVLIIGLEGAPLRRGIGIGSPLYTEAAIAKHLQMAVGCHPGPIFVVSHAPPFKILDNALRFGVNNIGSRSLRDFARRDPRVQLVVCGHCHRDGGKAAQFHRATIINAASHDGPEDLIRIAHYTWRRGDVLMSGSPPVDFEHARPWGELEAISGLWHTDYAKLWKAGITTLEHLASASAATLSSILGRRPELVEHFPLLAQARLSSKPVPIKPLFAPEKPRVYFDIETDPYGGNKLCWLVGVFDETTREFEQYLARTPAQEAEILKHFASFCATLGARPLVSYSGSNFDHRNVIARMRALGIPVPPSLQNAVDLLYPIQRAIALPCTGYRLKDVAACFGFTYRHRGIDGFTVALEYLRLSREKKRIPRRFLEYNEDDVRALQHLVTRVEELAGYAGWPIPQPTRAKRKRLTLEDGGSGSSALPNQRLKLPSAAK